MADIHLQLERLDVLVKSLIDQYEQAVTENDALQQKLQLLENELRQKNKEHEFLETELKNARVAQGMLHDSEHTGAARAQISALVREIDRCIALLNE